MSGLSLRTKIQPCFLSSGLSTSTMALLASKMNSRCFHFCHEWLLAQCLQFMSLMNYAIWRLVSMMDTGYELEIWKVEDLYAAAPQEYKLRAPLIDILVWRSSGVA